jgi:hypothetical protein
MMARGGAEMPAAAEALMSSATTGHAVICDILVEGGTRYRGPDAESKVTDCSPGCRP